MCTGIETFMYKYLFPVYFKIYEKGGYSYKCKYTVVCTFYVNFTFVICEKNIKRNVFTYCGTHFKKYSNKLIYFINRYLKLN